MYLSSASTPHIARLVRGLAEFEKEPESVHIGACDYAVDGFEGVPLFHCILVESVVDNMHICGMAFCYLANQYETGRFLFLEDLFFEEKYRGEGGGTMVMGALALVAQLLGCQRMVWQALDCKCCTVDCPVFIYTAAAVISSRICLFSFYSLCIVSSARVR